MTMEAASAEAAEPVEVVIISGPRRGEIVRLPDTLPAARTSAEDIEALNASLDQLIAAMDRVSREARATILSVAAVTAE